MPGKNKSEEQEKEEVIDFYLNEVFVDCVSVSVSVEGGEGVCCRSQPSSRYVVDVRQLGIAWLIRDYWLGPVGKLVAWKI